MKKSKKIYERVKKENTYPINYLKFRNGFYRPVVIIFHCGKILVTLIYERGHTWINHFDKFVKSIDEK
jgi:hypothetical protein